jgi:hypothetical protein
MLLHVGHLFSDVELIFKPSFLYHVVSEWLSNRIKEQGPSKFAQNLWKQGHMFCVRYLHGSSSGDSENEVLFDVSRDGHRKEMHLGLAESIFLY